jgi:hypothetical protein
MTGTSIISPLFAIVEHCRQLQNILYRKYNIQKFLHLNFEQMMAKIYAISVKLFMKGECCAVEGNSSCKTYNVGI